MTVLDPFAPAAAWFAAGCPEPNWAGRSKNATPRPPTREGVCALTGLNGDVVDARHVLSDMFTAWDRFPFQHVDPDGVAFSFAAAWAFRHRPFQQQPSAFIDGVFREQLKPSELRAALDNLGQYDAVCVPISRQKHVLPFAARGCVRVDDETITWTDRDRTLLATYAWFRSLGFGEAALTEPAPRWTILKRLDTPTAAAVLAAWDELDRWREHPVRLDVAARATRKDPEPA